MHYAISYVSSVNPNLTEDDIHELLKYTRNRNNDIGITGILLFSDGNFFQVLEGKKSLIKSLLLRIIEDERHNNVMIIFEKEVYQTKFDEYQSDFISLDSCFQSENIELYLSQIEKLNPKIQSSVRYILNNFAEGIK
jgi:hypothetical protein